MSSFRSSVFFHPLRPSMKRRCAGHDYCGRSMYMVTLVIEGRRRLFGSIVGDPSLPAGAECAASLHPSPLGAAVLEEWRSIPAFRPEVLNVSLQLMPDHLHFITYIKEPMPIPLGNVVAAFEARCRSRYNDLIADGQALPVPQYILDEQRVAKLAGRKSRFGLLFEPGFNDKILWRDGELQAWKAYLADNPRRYLVKLHSPTSSE